MLSTISGRPQCAKILLPIVALWLAPILRTETGAETQDAAGDEASSSREAKALELFSEHGYMLDNPVAWLFEAVIINTWTESHDLGRVLQALAARSGAGEQECLRYLEATVPDLGLVVLDEGETVRKRIREDFLLQSASRASGDRDLRDALLYFYAMQEPPGGRAKVVALLREEQAPAETALRLSQDSWFRQVFLGPPWRPEAPRRRCSRSWPTRTTARSPSSWLSCVPRSLRAPHARNAAREARHRRPCASC